MEIENLFWYISFGLASLGLIFGIIASVQSSNANRRVKDLVSDSFVSNGAAKLLFHDLKIASSANKKVLTLIKINKKLSYSVYSNTAQLTRLNLVPKRMKMIIGNTEFKEVVEFYIKKKNLLDDKFNAIFPDKEIFYEEYFIDKNLIEKLHDYHMDITIVINEIIRWYTSIVEDKSK